MCPEAPERLELHIAGDLAPDTRFRSRSRVESDEVLHSLHPFRALLFSTNTAYRNIINTIDSDNDRGTKLSLDQSTRVPAFLSGFFQSCHF